MTNVLVEGGAGLLGSFLDARAVDETHVYVAPVAFGGIGALPPVGGRGVADVADGLRLGEWSAERLGDDVLMHGRVAS